MVRAAASTSDRALLDLLSARGLTCSPYQLERWRSQRLLPRHERRFAGGGGSSSTPTPAAPEIAAALAGAARRGRPAQELALVLFAAGLPVQDDVLVVAVQWAAQRLFTQVQEFAAVAEQHLADLPEGTERFDDVLELAEPLAGQVLAGNGSWVRQTRRRLRSHDRSMFREQLDVEVLSAAIELATFLLQDLPDREGDGSSVSPDSLDDDDEISTDTLLVATGLGDAAGQVTDAAGALRAVTPSVLLQVASQLTTAQAPALWMAREDLLHVERQIAAGETMISADVTLTNRSQPQEFALLVLTWIIQAVRQAPSST